MKIVEQTESKLVLESGFGFVASNVHTFDKSTGKYTANSKGLIGGGHHTEHSLSEFTGVQVQEMGGSQDPSERTFRLELVKAGGQTLPMTNEYAGNLLAHQKVAEAIRPFLVTA